MRKTLTALLAAASLGIAAVPSLPSPAEARWGWGWGGFGVGLATGAIIGGALARPYYPYYGYTTADITHPPITIRRITATAIIRDITATAIIRDITATAIIRDINGCYSY